MKKHRSMLIGIFILCFGIIILPMGKSNVTVSLKASTPILISDKTVGESNPGMPKTPHAQQAGIRFTKPMNTGKITFRFGKGIHPFKKIEYLHNGIDIAANLGTPVLTAADGTVKTAMIKGDYGKLIIIEHTDGFQTQYAHLHEIQVESQQTVRAGDQIGLVGETGLSTKPHLHFSICKDGKCVDPEDYIDFE